ncbi:MAG: hypothetical protein U9P90_01745 [Patescibacteria group bacterium]|nr:hypothetical protein [Patescibacteria group bacterium]
MNNKYENLTSQNLEDFQPTPEPKPKYLKIIITILGILGIVVLTAFATYFIVKQYDPDDLNENQEKNNDFSTLTKPATPPFSQNIETNADVRVDFHYNGDYNLKRDYFANNYEYYTPPESNEKYLSISKAKDRKGFAYELPEYIPIFKSQESHSYQGTPVYILNSDDKSTLSYLGFKINNKSLVSELEVELGIDYNARDWTKANDGKNSFIASLLGIKTVQACGPGLYLRRVGNSALDFVQESDGILWYKLRTPIALHDLRLTYSDQDCSTKPSYCKNQYDDPQECAKYWTCFYNATIPDLAKGNLRMHIYYKPNDREGLFKLQVANVILSNTTGAFSQATMGDGFDHYYRAYFR